MIIVIMKLSVLILLSLDLHTIHQLLYLDSFKSIIDLVHMNYSFNPPSSIFRISISTRLPRLFESFQSCNFSFFHFIFNCSFLYYIVVIDQAEMGNFLSQFALPYSDYNKRYVCLYPTFQFSFQFL